MPDTSVGKCLPLYYIQITEILGAHQKSLEESKAMLCLPWAEICWREGSDLENKFMLCCISLQSKRFALPERKHFCYLLGNKSALLLWQCKFPVWGLLRGKKTSFWFHLVWGFCLFWKNTASLQGTTEIHSPQLCERQAVQRKPVPSTCWCSCRLHVVMGQVVTMTEDCNDNSLHQCDVIITMR